MKNFLTLILSIILISSAVTFAQNNAGKADDEGRIAITAQVSDQEIPAAAKKNLLNKMKQIATKNGLAGDSENPFFIMDATVDVLSKEITPTAPPMHSLSIQINFFIKGADGTIFSETSYTTKGVGKNETKAYLQGLKNINTSRGQFKAFVERGKEKIVEYYNSQCDFVISQAKAMHKQGRNDAAIVVLQSVPPVCKECYDMCMEVMAEIAPSEDLIKAETAAIVGGTSVANTSAGVGVEESADSTVATTAVVSAAATIAPFQVGDRVWANFGDTRAWHKAFSPAKVLKLSTAATKGESELISLGSGGASTKWIADNIIITKWHAAEKSEIKEGMVILYNEHGKPTKESSLRVGVIVLVDELYKNVVSIKGHYWGDLRKVNWNQIAIIDAPQKGIEP